MSPLAKYSRFAEGDARNEAMETAAGSGSLPVNIKRKNDPKLLNRTRQWFQTVTSHLTTAVTPR